MEWPLRIVGIGVIVGLFCWSLMNFGQSLDAMSAAGAATGGSTADASRSGSGTGRGAAGDDDAAGGAGSSIGADMEPPELLAFIGRVGPSYASGAYKVADSDLTRQARNDRDEELEDDEVDPYAAADLGLVPGTMVGGFAELEPGLYATEFGTRGCSYELWRVMQTGIERMIGQDFLVEGRLLATINEIEPDRFVSLPQCGPWRPWRPLAEPLVEAANGDYWMGDLEPGTWIVPDGCFWEKVVGFRGANLWDVQDSGHGPGQLEVDDSTLGVRIRNCRWPLTHADSTG